MSVKSYRLTLPSFIEGRLQPVGAIVDLEESAAGNHMVEVEEDPVLPPFDTEEAGVDTGFSELKPLPEPEDSIDVPLSIEPAAEKQAEAPAAVDAGDPPPAPAMVTILPVEDAAKAE